MTPLVAAIQFGLRAAKAVELAQKTALEARQRAESEKLLALEQARRANAQINELHQHVLFSFSLMLVILAPNIRYQHVIIWEFWKWIKDSINQCLSMNQ